ncbi:MAG: penicillin-binding protein 1C [Alistipes sp.]|jgi:penicillin-binding protein 1C|nr:penicillin-binding protein 1C [Alistipes sp.]
MNSHRFFSRRPIRAALLVAGGFFVVWLAGFAFVPRRLFRDPVSTLLYSREGELLSARIASDGQWRFPESDSLPERFVRCLVEYEDRRFWWHPGVDPAALVRAIRLNVSRGGVVSGGSTLTMQLARIARGGRRRTVGQKIIEAAWALHIETTASKRRILRLWASHAPFGGNVVGLEAAAWRWFGRSPWELSWAESAMLAVLPNSPAMIHPGRNRDALLTKRNRLLETLAARGVIDPLECSLACAEPLPEAPLPLPDEAPHLLERMATQLNDGQRLVSTLSRTTQRSVQQIVNLAAENLAANHIYNIAAIVADVTTGEVAAYAGNITNRDTPIHGERVDIIASERSTGSLLKPLLYAAMLDDGMLLPGTLVADTPLNINGFTPSNYDREFRGAVPAREAISRSLNVPLVRMLSRYNTGRFRSLLQRMGMTTLHYGEEHYGASLILGGAEGTLWDMAGIYASMARTLAGTGGVHPLSVTANRREENNSPSPISTAAIWSTFEAMSDLSRPEEEAEWRSFSSMRRVAWKTGTSYGSRDGWSVGVTPRWVVGVWVGNASGEGRAGLTGVGSAAPVMFDILSTLPSETSGSSGFFGTADGWFATPHDQLTPIAVCRRSGHRASEICDLVDTLLVPRAGIETPLCPYHRLVHLSSDGRWRVDSSCEPVENIVTTSWFVLPPAQEYYFRSHNPTYAPLPPARPDCRSIVESIAIVYPEHGSELFPPRGLGGAREQIVCSAAHSDRDATLFWWLDGDYLGQTSLTHRMAITPSPGSHTLTVSDTAGNRRAVNFTVKQ